MSLVGAGRSGPMPSRPQTTTDAPDAISVGPSLQVAFFDRPVVTVARELVGCWLLYDGAGGRIVETEAYHDSEPACHAYNGRTPRNAPLFGPPGRAYVYFTYGIHSLFNVVAEPEGVGAAVLVRAIEPLAGIEAMRRRRGRQAPHDLCSGPAKLTQALGIELSHNRSPIGDQISIHAPAPTDPPFAITALPRVGISKACDLDWRFCARDMRHVSAPRPR